MIETVQSVFKKVSCTTSKGAMPIQDCLFSGLALFSLKYPSLLQYDQDRDLIATNLKNLFGVASLPSDTYMRERLDEIDPQQLRRCFTKLFGHVQRSKRLEAFQHIQGTYLVSIDGTGYFSSKTVHCDECCVKNHRDGTKTYYHQILQAALVHPDIKQVIPFAPEPIKKQDGAKKNDCERNAAKRLLDDMRREHPKLSITILADALYGNTPFLTELIKHGMHYIIGVKPGDHAWLFDYISNHQCQRHELTDEAGYCHQFRFINDVPLNESNEDCRVNFIEYTEISPKGERKTFTWITDFTLSQDNVFAIMRAGRSRWRIENETFNTLKNQGYQFEHNFGHGYKHLSHVFAMLMLLAFCMDQIQEMACKHFQKALRRVKRRSYLWKRVMSVFFNFVIKSWESLYDGIADIMPEDRPVFNDTS